MAKSLPQYQQIYEVLETLPTEHLEEMARLGSEKFEVYTSNFPAEIVASQMLIVKDILDERSSHNANN